MTLRIVYVDESHDREKFCLSALCIRHQEWREAFDRVKQHRAVLKADYGIPLSKEIHAQEFVSGRGNPSTREIGKFHRTRIFMGLLNVISQLPNVMLINVCLDIRGRKDVHLDAWDRLLNRLERTMLAFEERELPLRKNLLAAVSEHLDERRLHLLEERLLAYAPRFIIIADEGKELAITRSIRRMHVFNYIPSRLGAWPDGERSRNIPIQRAIEDPVFKESGRSYFIQLVDCVAFALLKRESTPTPHVKRYGIDGMFEKCLAGVCFKDASRTDPLGIVRK